jgi:hypothetical protein
MLSAWRQSSEHHATCLGSRGRRIRCERMGDWSHCRHGRRRCRCSKRGSSCGDLLGCEGGAASCERPNARRDIPRTHTPKSSACRATYIDLSLLQAGVTNSLNSTGTNGFGGLRGTVYSSNGAPVISNNFLLDGTQIANQSNWGTASFAGTTLGVDGIQEYKVLTSTYDASYGMTMGSEMVMISKGGRQPIPRGYLRISPEQRIKCAKFL